MPAGPAQVGSHFKGWNTRDDGSGTAFNENTIITSDVTVYAQWEEHSFTREDADKWVTAPDCITDGTAVYKCSCGAEETRTVAGSKLGHDFPAVWTDNCDTHTDAGCTGHTKVCIRCEGNLTGGTQTEGHSYGEWIVDQAATMDTEGAKHRQCSDCGHIEKGTIPTLDKVTITIEYKDGETIVKTEAVVVTKDSAYDVTGEIKIPEGYETDGDPQNVSGTADTDKTVTVPVKKVQYTVTFNSNGGTAVDSQTVKYGELAVKPADPTRDGYTFNGWTLNGTPYDFSSPVTGNITLVAQWTRNSTTGGNTGGGTTTRYDLTVRYEYQDGTQAAPAHTSRHASGYRYSVTSPVIEGYTPDQAVVSGRLTSDVEITVVYTADEAEIPDENPPLVEVPDEEPPLVDQPDVQIPDEEPPLVEIPEEEPPLAEIPLDPTPKTGDGSRTGLWAALCGISLLGMITLLGKKKKDGEA